jgi:hypothetical protein
VDAIWVWGVALIAITIAIHSTGIVLIARTIARFWGGRLGQTDALRHTTAGPIGLIITIAGPIGIIVAVSVSLATLHAIEAAVWAIAYVNLGALTSPADAALYSLDSMTTRGAAGFSLASPWRMMGAIEAANGVLLFGISTAFVFAVMQRIFRTPGSTLDP